MLALLDAVALSVWPKAHSRRLARLPVAGRTWMAPPRRPDAVDGARGRRRRAGGTDRRQAAPKRGPRYGPGRRQRGITPIPWGDARVPAAARDHPRPARRSVGAADSRGALHRPAVALVGSRAASPYGLEAATRLAAELAADGHGHRQRPRPRRRFGRAPRRPAGGRHSRWRCSAPGSTSSTRRSTPRWPHSIAEAGAVVSELPPGTPPRALHFPGPQPDHQRSLAGGRRRRGRRAERVADHRGVRRRAGPRGHGGARAASSPAGHGGCHALIRDGAAIVEFCGRDRVGTRAPAGSARWPAARGRSTGVPGNPLLERMAPAKPTTSTAGQGDRPFAGRSAVPVAGTRAAGRGPAGRRQPVRSGQPNVLR